MAILHAARSPEGNCLRPVTDPAVIEQLLEVGAHGSVRHAESLRDLLIRKSVRSKRQDLRLARRQAAAAEVGPAICAVPSANVTASETMHRFITRGYRKYQRNLELRLSVTLPAPRSYVLVRLVRIARANPRSDAPEGEGDLEKPPCTGEVDLERGRAKRAFRNSASTCVLSR